MFIDDFSRYTTIYFLKKKSEVLTHFKQYFNLVIRQHDLPIQVLRSDNGGEYNSCAFEAFCKDEGIQQQFTVSYTPQQNGVSERKNRTLVEAARAMLLTVVLPKSYWEEAIATTCYVQN
jgi:transposase InsO family protein